MSDKNYSFENQEGIIDKKINATTINEHLYPKYKGIPRNLLNELYSGVYEELESVGAFNDSKEV